MKLSNNAITMAVAVDADTGLVVVMVPGDELALCMTVLWTNYDGETKLCKVTGLELLNDDVVVTGTNGLNYCLVGARHTWKVVADTHPGFK